MTTARGRQPSQSEPSTGRSAHAPSARRDRPVERPWLELAYRARGRCPPASLWLAEQQAGDECAREATVLPPLPAEIELKHELQRRDDFGRDASMREEPCKLLR